MIACESLRHINLYRVATDPQFGCTDRLHLSRQIELAREFTDQSLMLLRFTALKFATIELIPIRLATFWSLSAKT